MKRQRTQEKLAEPQALQPAAAPTDIYYKAAIPAPDFAPIYDFGPLSTELAQLMSQSARDNAEREIAEGRQFGDTNPKIAAQVNDAVGKVESPEEALEKYRNEFGKLVRDGTLPEAASPFFLRGFAQASARQVVTAYHGNLLQRVAEVSALTDDQGLPAKPVDPQTILAEEWEKLAENPALANFYGRQAAGELKARVDEDFLAKAAAERADATATHHKTMLSNEVAVRVSALEAKGDITAEDLQGLTDWITKTQYETNVRDPRAVAWEGIHLALKQTANEKGAAKALRLLDSVSELKVAGVAIGKDAQLGGVLADMKASLLRQEEYDEDDERQRRNEQREEDILAGRQKYLGRIHDAYTKGENMVAVRDQIIEEINVLKEFGENTPLVIDALLERADSLGSRAKTDPEIERRLASMVARGDVEAAQALFTQADKDRMLSADDILKWDAHIEAAQAISPQMQNSASYQETRGLIRSAGNVTDLNPEVQARHQEFVEGLDEEYRMERTTLVQSLRGQNDADAKLLEFDRVQGQKIRQKIRDREAATRAERKPYEADLAKRMSLHTDASDIIEEAYKNGLITTQEYGVALARNDAATDRSPWYRGQEVQNALSAIDIEIQAQELDDITKARLGDVFTRAFEDKWHAMLDEKLPKLTSPRYVESAVREATRAAADEITAQLGAGITAEMQKAAKSGKSGADVAQVEKVGTDAGTRVKQYEEEDRKPDGYDPESKAIADKLHPLLPERLAGAYSEVLRGASDETEVKRGFLSWWNVSRTSKLQDEIGVSVFELLDNTELPEAERDDAVVRAVSLYGLTADNVLSGSVTVQRAPIIRDLVTKEIEANDAVKLSKGAKVLVDRQSEKLRQKWLRTEQVDLSSAEIDGYTTPLWRTTDEFREFTRTRSDDFTALLERFKVPQDDTSIQRFIDAQNQAIRRTYR